jgi:hypothetical protein
MSLTKQNIIDYARRYVEDAEVGDFPHEGDLFCLFERDISASANGNNENAWNFAGYGISIGYTLDEESKPEGKWIWFYYIGLESFPPARQAIKLQPPHVVRGIFQNADRAKEVRIAKVAFTEIDSTRDTPANGTQATAAHDSGKILKFPSNN